MPIFFQITFFFIFFCHVFFRFSYQHSTGKNKRLELNPNTCVLVKKTLNSPVLKTGAHKGGKICLYVSGYDWF